MAASAATSFAVPTITGEVKRYFRNHGWTVRPPRRVQELHAALSAATADVAQTLGTSPTVGDLAEHLDVDVHDVLEATASHGCFSASSIDYRGSDGDDDSAEIRSLIKAQLRLSGLLEVVADGADGVEAIGLAYQHQPSLLLLDRSMPVMDGLDTLPGVLAIAPDTLVVIYSGFEERDLAQRAIEIGAAGFIEKSIPIDTLADRLIAMLPPGTASGRPATSSPRQLSAVGDEPVPVEGRRAFIRDQALLNEHLERFREVFNEAAIGMATMTLTGTIVHANRALGALMLWEHQDLVGVDYGMLTSGGGELLDSALTDINERSIDLVQFEHDVGGWDDARRALAILAPVRDSKGQALYVFLQVQDITAQSKVEGQLRRSEERFRLLVEAVDDYAIFMLDPHGHVVSWNAGAQRIKGYSVREIIGQHFRVFYRPILSPAIGTL